MRQVRECILERFRLYFARREKDGKTKELLLFNNIVTIKTTIIQFDRFSPQLKKIMRKWYNEN